MLCVLKHFSINVVHAGGNGKMPLHSSGRIHQTAGMAADGIIMRRAWFINERRYLRNFTERTDQ
jgi:hypothetical protein